MLDIAIFHFFPITRKIGELANKNFLIFYFKFHYTGPGLAYFKISKSNKNKLDKMQNRKKSFFSIPISMLIPFFFSFPISILKNQSIPIDSDTDSDIKLWLELLKTKNVREEVNEFLQSVKCFAAEACEANGPL